MGSSGFEVDLLWLVHYFPLFICHGYPRRSMRPRKNQPVILISVCLSVCMFVCLPVSTHHYCVLPDASAANVHSLVVVLNAVTARLPALPLAWFTHSMLHDPLRAGLGLILQHLMTLQRHGIQNLLIILNQQLAHYHFTIYLTSFLIVKSRQR